MNSGVPHPRWFCLFLLLVFPLQALAHPLDEANLYHFFSCELTPRSLTLDYKALVGGLVVFKTWNEMDTDRNHVLSKEEVASFSRRLANGLSLTLDGKPVAFHLTGSQLPAYDDFIAGTVPYLQFNLKAAWAPLAPGRHTLVVINKNYAAYTNLYPRTALTAFPPNSQAKAETGAKQKGFTLTFITTDPLPSVTALRSTANKTASTAPEIIYGDDLVLKMVRVAVEQSRAMMDDKKSAASPKQKLPTSIPSLAIGDSASMPSPSASADFQTLKQNRSQSASNRLMGYVTGGRMTLTAFFGALFVAVLLGAGHALTPGHGKALVGAYLVGERGTVRDAVFLGLVVTFAHTATVYLFGLVILGLVHFVNEKQLGVWLGVGSGLLVIATGFWLLLRGLLRWYGVDVDHHHHHDYEDGHSHTHEHGEDHSHKHVHHHHHHPHPGTGRGSLLSLGIAGGAVPCPDAIAVLAASINAGNVAFGLVLITAFSAGMATVLIAIGILMVTAKARMARFTGEGRFFKALPIISAAIVLVLGLGLVGQALAQAGILVWNRP